MSLAVEPRIESPRIVSKRPAGAEPLRRKRAIPASTSGFRRRAVHLLLVFVTVVLVVDALIGEKGLMQSMRARQEYLDMAASLETLRRNNAKLRDEMRRLNEDPATIESVAREQLGLIRPGEVVFILKDAKN
jgi:cell division protein FtsB